MLIIMVDAIKLDAIKLDAIKSGDITLVNAIELFEPDDLAAAIHQYTSAPSRDRLMIIKLVFIRIHNQESALYHYTKLLAHGDIKLFKFAAAVADHSILLQACYRMEDFDQRIKIIAQRPRLDSEDLARIIFSGMTHPVYIPLITSFSRMEIAQATWAAQSMFLEDVIQQMLQFTSQLDITR